MAWIRTLSPAEGGQELAAVHAYMREVGGIGVVANIVRLFSLRPGSMR